MRIQIKSDGGFAVIPGIQSAVDLDTSTMNVSDAEHLESLIQSADFFKLPPRIGEMRGADRPTYTITIDWHTIVVVEGSASPALQRLIDRLRAAGRSGVRGGGSTTT